MSLYSHTCVLGTLVAIGNCMNANTEGTKMKLNQTHPCGHAMGADTDPEWCSTCERLAEKEAKATPTQEAREEGAR